MALDIDGFAVLQRMAAHPRAFPAIATEVTKAARTLVIKQVKHKSTDLTTLRDICKTLGEADLNLILDGLPESQIKTLVNRLDKFNPGLKTSDAHWRRQQLSALANGKAEPSAKLKAPPRRQPTKKTKAKEEPEVLNYRSAGATRRR